MEEKFQLVNVGGLAWGGYERDAGIRIQTEINCNGCGNNLEVQNKS